MHHVTCICRLFVANMTRYVDAIICGCEITPFIGYLNISWVILIFWLEPIFTILFLPTFTNRVYIEWLKAGRKGTLDCKLYWYPKFYKHVLSFAGSKTLGDLIEFSLVTLNSLSFNFSTYFFLLWASMGYAFSI